MVKLADLYDALVEQENDDANDGELDDDSEDDETPVVNLESLTSLKQLFDYLDPNELINVLYNDFDGDDHEGVLTGEMTLVGGQIKLFVQYEVILGDDEENVWIAPSISFLEPEMTVQEFIEKLNEVTAELKVKSDMLDKTALGKAETLEFIEEE